MKTVPVENVEGNFIFHLMFKELFDRDRLLGDETHVQWCWLQPCLLADLSGWLTAVCATIYSKLSDRSACIMKIKIIFIQWRLWLRLSFSVGNK